MNGGSTMIQKRQAGLYIAAAAVRLLLIAVFPGLPDLLTGRVEISTPVSSFKRLQEGLFLYNHNVSPYDGGVYHQAPLLLPLFSLLPSAKTWPIFSDLLFVAVDLLSARALSCIAESGEAGASALFTSPRRHKRWSGTTVAALFLFNPFTVATCLGRSTTVFSTCAILHAIAKAVSGAPLGAMVSLSFAAYLSMYPLLLLPPLTLLAFDRRRAGQTQAAKTKAAGIRLTMPSDLPRFSAACAAVVAACLLVLLAMSSACLLTTTAHRPKTGDGASSSGTAFLSATYGVQLTLSDLMPNVGLWWYFFIEIFDSFRAFFVAVFWLHLSSYVGGLSLRIRRQPLVVLTLLTGIFAIFKPYPSIADTSLFLALVPLFRHVFPLMRYSFVVAATILYAAFLGPAFYHLWIFAGSGNANFFYAITLVWSLGQSLLVSDLTFAVLRDEWELDRPEMVGKDIRQI